MQSETLKYLYLLFSDPDTLPLEGERRETISCGEGSDGSFADTIAFLCRLRVQHRGKRAIDT